jgi:hypothetical protein
MQSSGITKFAPHRKHITSRRWLWRMPSSGILRFVPVVRTDVSEERSSSIIRVTKIGGLGMLAVTSSRDTLRRFLVWDHATDVLWSLLNKIFASDGNKFAFTFDTLYGICCQTRKLWKVHKGISFPWQRYHSVEKESSHRDASLRQSGVEACTLLFGPGPERIAAMKDPVILTECIVGISTVEPLN